MTDDARFEEPEPQRCPACLATVEPGQQYCLACGERLTPGDPLVPRGARPAAAIIALGLLLLLIGGLGIAYGFTRGNDTTTSAATTTHVVTTTGPSAPPTASSAPVPTFTSVPATTFSSTTVPTFSTAPTPPPTTTALVEKNDWPSGTDGWAVLLMSRSTQQYDYAYITQQKTAAEDKGISNAGVLNSDDFPTLNPGYWVLYMGPYTSRAAAQAAVPTAVAGGYSDAYVRNVAE